MIKNKYITTVLFILLVLLKTAGAQNKNEAEQTVDRILHQYDSLDEYSINADLNLYKNYVSNTVEETQDIKFIKSGSSIFNYMSSGYTVLANKNYTVKIDDNNKNITVSQTAPPSKEESRTEQKTPLLANIKLDMTLDSFLKAMDIDTTESGERYSFAETNNGSLKAVKIKFGKEEGVYEEIVIYFSPADYLINKVVIYCKESFDITEKGIEEKPRIEVNYQTGFKIDKSVFSENNYIKKTGDKTIGVGKYANYKISDYTNKKVN